MRTDLGGMCFSRYMNNPFPHLYLFSFIHLPSFSPIVLFPSLFPTQHFFSLLFDAPRTLSLPERTLYPPPPVQINGSTNSPVNLSPDIQYLPPFLPILTRPTCLRSQTSQTMFPSSKSRAPKKPLLLPVLIRV